MMIELVIAAAALACTAMLCLSALVAWRGWLDLRRLEIGRAEDFANGSPDGGVRIELAHVKERLRRLEAIANGVEL